MCIVRERCPAVFIDMIFWLIMVRRVSMVGITLRGVCIPYIHSEIWITAGERLVDMPLYIHVVWTIRLGV